MNSFAVQTSVGNEFVFSNREYDSLLALEALNLRIVPNNAEISVPIVHSLDRKLTRSLTTYLEQCHLPPRIPFENFKFKLPPVELVSGSFFEMGVTKKEDYILVARPLKELLLHVKNLKLPSFALIARCIKTLVLGIFRWHLCDQTLIKSETKLLHSLSGKVTIEDGSKFEEKYPFMLESAFVLKLKDKDLSRKEIAQEELGTLETINPDAIRKYFQLGYGLEITEKLRSNTINDLFGSKHLKLSNTW